MKYFKDVESNLNTLPYAMDYWKKEWKEIPPTIPIHDAIDIYLRINDVSNAKSLFNKLNTIGIYEEKEELYIDTKDKLNSYPIYINQTIEFIRNNEGIEQSKARKELIKNIDKQALTWILNRTYFIKKVKKDNKNYLYINEEFLNNGE